MRKSTFIMIGVAVVFGLLAVFVAQSWLNHQAEANRRRMQVAPVQAATRTIVVAKEPLRFGAEVTEAKLAEVTWSADAVPAGAYSNISEILNHGRRLVLAPIEVNEPVLAVKLTGPGERATLSALVQPGKKAVTIRVNDVEGVGGFVLPGDRVDVVLTRQLDKGNATSDVVLQNVRVLAVDQQADVRSTKPSIAKAVTLEVAIEDAQKIALASQVGSLSLLLRKAGEATAESTRTITLDDMFKKFVAGSNERRATTTVTVTRAMKREDYSVLKESDGRAAGADRM